ncbi:hypothetical protein ACJ73_02059 [Blastomyces percursus]|uniref:Uncharacterized protein n=1 Tax=Blastomyces percursus TaxID=1658174 RepID=A0A1J9QEL2_9EURO|nr:hypothetical protein ACJ73_02059 [Blastomyces percursus]
MDSDHEMADAPSPSSESGGSDMLVDIDDAVQTKEGESTFKPTASKPLIMKELNIPDDDEWTAFLQGPLVKPYWRHLFVHYIYPEQQRAKRARKTRPRGPALKDVSIRLINGEKQGKKRFSAPWVDHSDWTAEDHLAYFLYHVRTWNATHQDGIFWSRQVPEPDMDAYVWSIYLWLTQAHAPSRINRPNGGRNLFPDIVAEAVSIFGQKPSPRADSKGENSVQPSPSGHPSGDIEKTPTRPPKRVLNGDSQPDSVIAKIAKNPPTLQKPKINNGVLVKCTILQHRWCSA